MTKLLEVLEVQEGRNEDYNDIKVLIENQSYWVKDIPLLDKDGREVSYEEALEIYGEDGLADDIWSDDNYIKNLENYLKENDVELEK